jgi:hypothetical protein
VVSNKKKGGKKANPNAPAKLDWHKVATSLGIAGIGHAVCKKRYEYLKDLQVGKGPWTAHEDEKILGMVTSFGKFHLSENWLLVVVTRYVLILFLPILFLQDQRSGVKSHQSLKEGQGNNVENDGTTI